MDFVGLAYVGVVCIVSAYVTHKMCKRYEGTFRRDVVEMVKSDKSLQEEIKKWL